MPVVPKTKIKPYGHGVGVRPTSWHNGGYHLYEPNCFIKKSFSSSSNPDLYRNPTISVDPAIKKKVFEGTLERVATDEDFRASMAKHYSLLMRRKTDKDLPSAANGEQVWRGTRPGLEHPLGVFSYSTSLGNGEGALARPASAPPAAGSRRLTRSRSSHGIDLRKTRWAGPESWLEGPWKDCGPSGGLYDSFPKVKAQPKRAQSAPPERRY
jgi:hypothetical protein